MSNEISIQVKIRNQKQQDVIVPYDIDEVMLKGYLRDWGLISSYRESYSTTRVFLLEGLDKIEICSGNCRTLEEIGIEEGSILEIVPGRAEPVPVNHYYSYSYPVYKNTSRGWGRALYGCPMSKEVEDYIVSTEDISVESGTIKA